MKKLFFTLLLFAALVFAANAQETATIKPIKLTDTAKLYNPKADAKADIAAAVKRAKAEHKNVLLQMGGNWCIWCIRFNDLVTQDPKLDKYLRNNYEVVHVNYSPENLNEKLFAELGFPQRFGFPVFVVLDDKGNRLHTQNSAYLEDGPGHSKAKVMEFFENWSPTALDPKSYEPKPKTKAK
jgi:thioredoxin-related protein